MQAAVISLLLLGVSAPAFGLSPWFSSEFLHVQQAIQRYSYCHQLPPITTSNMNAGNYLVHMINKFFDVANYDTENLNATIKLFDQMCIPDGQQYGIIGDIDKDKFLESKSLRCATMDEIMEKIYPELRRSAVNNSIVLDFENLDYQPRKTSNGTIDGFYKNLVSFINTAWIQSSFEKERLCEITNNVTAHLVFLRDVQKSSYSTKRAGQEKAVTNEGFIGTIKYYLDSIFSLYTKIYLTASSEAAQARMSVASGLHATAGFVKNAFTWSKKSELAGVAVPVNVAAPNNLVAVNATR